MQCFYTVKCNLTFSKNRILYNNLKQLCKFPWYMGLNIFTIKNSYIYTAASLYLFQIPCGLGWSDF